MSLTVVSMRSKFEKSNRCYMGLSACKRMKDIPATELYLYGAHKIDVIVPKLIRFTRCVVSAASKKVATLGGMSTLFRIA